MNSKVKYVLPAFAAVFVLMFAAATPYVIAEPGQEKDWNGDYHGSDYAKKDIRQDMAEKLNSYCEMSAEEQAELIEKYDKTEEKVAKMNEYCSLDEAGKQAFIEEHKDEYKKYSEDKMRHDSKKHHMTIKVEGFTGAITIPEMTEETDMKAVHEELKSQVSVKFSDAAALAEDAGLDVMKGSIGMAVNENGEKFVVWMLAEMNMDDSESDTMSTTVFVVDAADTTNTAQTTKEYDHSKMMNKDKRYSHDKQQQVGNYEETLSDPEQIENKIAKIEEKLSDGGTGNVAKDDLKSQFLEVLKQLQTAITNGDDAQADSLREQLNDLRNQMTEMKRHN
ncbi:hypothetical protein [Nitrosopumilus sp.]|uniref:hypothetical protein n=1 Tax=Nitrosopumilus sp. TaxID=2024843 RepID=UPI002930CBD0|nr:hypothetical protein [Nitrosopumilus sp.]